MELAQFTIGQWLVAISAAVLVGMSKTGIPGVGILLVPLFGLAFDAKWSVGTVLPLLIVADLHAVVAYGRHCEWRRLVGLVPWVGVGLILGLIGLVAVEPLARGLGLDPDTGLFRPLIGLLVLAMATVFLLQGTLRTLVMGHPATTATMGVTAGVATTLANAAGPVMNLYLAARGLSKDAYMGTLAWFFLLLNVAKLPIIAVCTWWHPGRPMFTATSCWLDLILMPAVALGAWCGLLLLQRIPRQVFMILVVVLAVVGGLDLLLSPWLHAGPRP